MPPLNALKAFEAAARHESFAKAADELGVTPAAISHQIKALEEWLGNPLFVRHAQGLHLTEPGRSAAQAFSDAFDALGRAVQDLRAAAPAPDFSIAALPAIAQLWLGPRLPGLRAAFPELRLSIHALETPPDFRREPFDMAIFLMAEPPDCCRHFVLDDDVIFPVCSPGIAAALMSPADLAGHPLLRDTRWSGDWACWLAAAAASGIAADDGPAFSLYSLAVQAAIDGAGVLMGHAALLSAPIGSGSLVAPFPIKARTGQRLVLLASDRPSARAAGVIDWLIANKP